MTIAAYLIAALTAGLSLACVKAARKRRDWAGKKVVHLPFFLAVVGMVCGGILCIPMLLCARDGERMSVFFDGIVLACDCLPAAYLNCVIRYDDDGFVARNFFGIKRACSYAQVEGIRTGKDRRIYFQGHSVMIDALSCGGDRFIEAIEKGHRRATGKWVRASTSYRRKWDPMNGHLDSPWFYFLLWITVGLICVALPVFAVVSMTSESDPADIVVHDVRFSAYEVDGKTLKLYVDGDEKPYEIAYFRDYGESLPEPEVLCGGAVYAVGVEGAGRFVRSLTGTDGTRYITPQPEREIYRDRQRPAAWTLGVCSVLGLTFCCFGIAVARHPERYSPKVRRLFYKDRVLH